MTNEESSVADWMTRDFFKSVVVKYEGHDHFQLNDYVVNSGSNKGENFASSIFRATVNYRDESDGSVKDLSFIIKARSDSAAVSEMLEDFGVFEGETHVYSNILSQSNTLIPGFKFSPKLICADKNALVLEDLSRHGFVLADRKKRFDSVKTKIVLRKLAMFHATTMKLHESNPELMEKHLSSAIDSEEMTPIAYFFTVSMQESLQTIKNTPELEHFFARLEKFDIVEREKKVFSRSDEDRFHAMNHGDLWINNVFFSFNENQEPTDTLLVDFQECFWGSVGIDLNHLMFTSCNCDVIEKVDDFLKFYHEQLTIALKQVNFARIPSFNDVKEEFERKADQGVIATLSILPVMMIENPEHAKVENFIGEGEEAEVIRREVYSNPKFVEILKFVLPKFNEKKLF